MAKDPAFLFYSSDFLTGTMFMSDEQVGKYIRILCAQHQKGHLSEEDMMKICKTYDKHIFSKFQRDSDGFYYNARLEEEDFKRKQYCESRSKNRKTKPENSNTEKNICNSYVPHMENENENKDNYINDDDKKATFNAFSKKLFESELDISAIEISSKKKVTKDIVKAFNAHCINQSKNHSHYSEWKKHLSYWVNKLPAETKKYEKYVRPATNAE